MVSKGKRPVRAAAPNAVPVEAVDLTATASGAGKPVEDPSEKPTPVEAVARGLEALSVEATGLAISGIDAATRTATDMLGIKTLSDAIEVNAGFTRSSFDALVGGSAKLSELGMKLATEASRPILTQLGKSWIKAARLAF